MDALGLVNSKGSSHSGIKPVAAAVLSLNALQGRHLRTRTVLTVGPEGPPPFQGTVGPEGPQLKYGSDVVFMFSFVFFIVVAAACKN